jgi:magnesium transporter
MHIDEKLHGVSMPDSQTLRPLSDRIRALDPQGAMDRLQDLHDGDIARTLAELGPMHAIEILEKFPAERRTRIAAAASSGEGEQWLRDCDYPESSVGRLMEPTPAMFRPETPVATVVDAMRDAVKRRLITYIFATDAEGRLVGVVTFRELLYALPGQSLADVMVRNPFRLRPETSLVDAMREVVTRHYPVYPV